jgi:NitT/TauT family transport system substrate-binding protein
VNEKRREIVRLMGAAGVAGLAGLRMQSAYADAPAETKRIRIALSPAGSCWAPQLIAQDLLRAEGFTDLQYVPPVKGRPVYASVAAGDIDMSMAFIAPFVVEADTGGQVVMLAGIHPGCIELYGSERVRKVRDLKGKSVSTTQEGGPGQAFIAAMLAHVGLDPRRDVKWVVQPDDEGIRQLAEGKVDAKIAAPPRSFDMRAKKIGNLIVNMTVDRPWSQYFCCVLTGNREFVRKHPAATKRAMRAILKSADLCVSDPERSARVLAGFPTIGGAKAPYEMALQTIREVPYARWRDFDTGDTVRFYALRLQEAGLIKSSPQKILAQATDLRFLNELKKELKA